MRNEGYSEELAQIILERSSPLSPIPTTTEASLRRLSGIRAVLFDVYGTLFISGSGDIGTAARECRGQILAESMRATGLSGNLQPAGEIGAELFFNAIASEHQERKLAGTEHPEIDIIEVWRRVLQDLQRQRVLSPTTLTGDLVCRLAVEYECRTNPVWPMPGVGELIGALSESSLVMGIVANAQFLTPLLFKAFLKGYPEELGFDRRLCVWSHELREAKPSERLFKVALNHLEEATGLPYQSVLYVGNDVRNDIWPAGILGMKTALFAGDQRSLRLRETDPNCSGTAPDVVLTTLLQILMVLEN